jgi:hypothetical protein
MSNNPIQTPKKELLIPENVIPLKPVGKGPNNSWLRDLPEGAVFVSRRRPFQGNIQIFLDVWTLVNNRGKSFTLSTDPIGDDNTIVFKRVDPDDFSQVHELVEVLEEQEQVLDKKE